MAGPGTGQTNRIVRLMEELQKDLPEGITDIKQVDAADVRVWSALFHGPKDTPYEGGIFPILIEFPPEFPFKPPKIRFNPPLYHPNIYEDGSISLNPNDPNQWTPRSVLGPILSSISLMIANPSIDDKPANEQAAALYSSNKEEFINKIRAEMAKTTTQ